MLGDPALLWDRFGLFSPFTSLALAPVDAVYSIKKKNPRIPFYGLPGTGLNGGVILMNLTRLRALPGGGFTGTVRSIWDEYKGNLPFPDQESLTWWARSRHISSNLSPVSGTSSSGSAGQNLALLLV